MTQTGGRGDPQSAIEHAATVADLGEFGLIERLARVLGSAQADPLHPASEGEIAIGDDAAAWRPPAHCWEVLTTDALVEGVHFRLTTTTWRDLGWKSLAENVSDVAAMGGQPRRAFVTLGVPGSTRVADLEDLYRGMHELASTFRVAIVGGDTVAAPVVFVNVVVVGEVNGPGLRRATGRPGDLLAVTGPLGGSRGGLELLEAGVVDSADADEKYLVARHRRPAPRVREGLCFAEVGVRCGMDLSDGLLGDAAKLARASSVGVTIHAEQVPLDPALARRFGPRARDLALEGGEDYELLIAAPSDVIERAARALARDMLEPPTVIGELTAERRGEVVLLDRDGRPLGRQGASWDHFGRSGRRDQCSGSA